MNNNIYNSINKIYNLFLSRKCDTNEYTNYIKYFYLKKITMKDIIILVTNSDEYVGLSKIKLNKLFLKIHNRNIKNDEFNKYIELLKKNGNNLSLIENIIKKEKKSELSISDKINKIFNKLLDRDANKKVLLQLKEKIEKKELTYDDIEHNLLLSEECIKLTNDKMNNWINENKNLK